jgi:hypothetical protein
MLECVCVLGVSLYFVKIADECPSMDLYAHVDSQLGTAIDQLVVNNVVIPKNHHGQVMKLSNHCVLWAKVHSLFVSTTIAASPEVTMQDVKSSHLILSQRVLNNTNKPLLSKRTLDERAKTQKLLAYPISKIKFILPSEHECVLEFPSTDSISSLHLRFRALFSHEIPGIFSFIVPPNHRLNVECEQPIHTNSLLFPRCAIQVRHLNE